MCFAVSNFGRFFFEKATNIFVRNNLFYKGQSVYTFFWDTLYIKQLSNKAECDIANYHMISTFLAI